MADVFPAVDSTTNRFHDVVRTQLASDLGDPAQVEGAAVAGVVSGALADFKPAVSDPLDWVTNWVQSAFAPPPLSDRPTVSWAATATTALASPVVYTPPVLNTGAAVTGWDGASDPVFRYLPASYSTGNGANGDLALYGEYKPGGSSSNGANWPVVFSFVTDATNSVVEIPFYARDGVLIEINGQLLSDVMYYSYIASNARQLTLTFPTARSRTIRIWSQGGLIAVRVPTGGSLTKPPQPKKRVAIIGDSYVNGSGSTDQFPPGAGYFETFAPRLLRLMRAGEPVLVGIGGTGFLAGAGSTPRADYYSRVSTVVGFNPDILVFYASQNDGTSGTGLQDAVASTLAACSTVPKVYVFGTLLDGYQAANAAVKAATVAAGRTYVDMDAFLYGSGAIDNPTGDGNKDIFLLSGSNPHMSLPGHKAAAATMYKKIAP